MFVNSLARERYPINYIYGFDSEGFSYFLTTQMKQTSPSSYHSKLVRVCHDDSDYYSYTEIPIQCISGQDSEDYTLVQVSQSYVEYFALFFVDFLLLAISSHNLLFSRLLMWASQGLILQLSWESPLKMTCCLLYSVPQMLQRGISPQSQVKTAHCVCIHWSPSGENSCPTYRDVLLGRGPEGWILSPQGKYLLRIQGV